MRKLLPLLVCAVLLAGCGFRPLYANSVGSGAENTGPISVEEVDGRSGYMLRQALIRELATGLPGISQSAVLSIDLRENITRAALLPDGAVSRSAVEARGRYVLKTANGSITGTATSSVPFGAIQSPYADVSAQAYASERAMDELSRRIVNQLRIQAQNQE